MMAGGYTGRVRRTILLVAAAVAVAVAAWLLHGPGALGYDSLWGLRWGDAIRHGHAPAFVGPDAPTPHPLVNLASAVLMVLGTDAATTILLAVSWLSLGALAVVVARFATQLFGWPVGVFAALALTTRQLLVVETAQAFVDLPFLALAVGALDRELRRPRDGWTVPVLLVLAGLLRPEGWALELAYLVYRRDFRIGALLALAPVVWAGMDLWATGDALHSLHGTQALGAELDRPRSAGTAVTLAPAALRDVVQSPLLWVALAGALAGLLGRERASRVPGGVLILGLAGYLVLGVAGLPLLGRYLLLPALMLIVFAGLAVLGWTADRRPAWRLLGAAAAIAVIAGIPADVRALQDANAFGARLVRAQDSLRAAVRATEGRGCDRALAPDRRALATIIAQRLGARRGATGTLYFTYADRSVAIDYALGVLRQARLPRRARPVYANAVWRVGAVGC
ncbi:MAG: hypothetical protein QOI80_3616 [Solirubrobacteraceae bacterium]|jgi:hypothetical protein|nr:hypothetical protein [Solirubrobacteraceae bacterium]